MIQFNLLPKVKLDYVKARRNKRTVALIGAAVTAGSLAILILLFIAVQVVQRKYSSDLSKDIDEQTLALQAIPDLDKVLTIQNQLNSLTVLHDQKPVISRVFTYIRQVTPSKITIATLKIDFSTNTASIIGKADKISTINKFADTLKFTTFKAMNEQTQTEKTGNAFSKVVLASFGKDEDESTYELSLSFDPIIFSSNEKITLIVPPGKITTRSETEKPIDLFAPNTTNSGTGQ
jgi:hypothetical protein